MHMQHAIRRNPSSQRTDAAKDDHGEPTLFISATMSSTLPQWHALGKQDRSYRKKPDSSKKCPWWEVARAGWPERCVPTAKVHAGARLFILFAQSKVLFY